MATGVVYTRYKQKLIGKLNSDRQYQVDFSEATMKIRTFHFLDGMRVKICYRGNENTCGWCHQGRSICPEQAVAKVWNTSPPGGTSSTEMMHACQICTPSSSVLTKWDKTKVSVSVKMNRQIHVVAVTWLFVNSLIMLLCSNKYNLFVLFPDTKMMYSRKMIPRWMTGWLIWNINTF